MPNAADYEKEADRILEELAPGGHFSGNWSTPAEARAIKRRVAQTQKQLRSIKKALTLAKRLVSADFVQRRVMVGKGIGSGLIALAFGRRASGTLSAVRREGVRVERLAALAPFEAVVAKIDDLIAQLDATKLEIDRKLLE